MMLRPIAFLIAGASAVSVGWWLRGGMPDGTSISWLLMALAALVAFLAAGDAAQAASLRGQRQALAGISGAAACAVPLLGVGHDLFRLRLISRSVEAPVELPGVAIVLGAFWLAALGGTLLLAADRLAVGASALAPRVARRALMLAGSLGVIAVGLLAKEAVAGEPVAAFAGLGAGLVAATGLLALGTGELIVNPATGDAARAEARASWLTRLAAALAVAGLLAAGIEAWQQEGSYLLGPTRMVLPAALAGLAAVQVTGLRLLRVLVFAGLLAAALVAA